MGREQKIMLGIERIILSQEKYGKLSCWEKLFLQGMSRQWRKTQRFSIKQKNTAFPILKRMNEI